MGERLDTNSIFKKGTFNFQVNCAPEKVTTKEGKKLIKFRFDAAVNGKFQDYSERFFPSQMAPLLRAMDFKEIEDGVFEWEPSDCAGKWIKATIIHEPDKNTAGKFWPRMSDIQKGEAEEIEIPF